MKKRIIHLALLALLAITGFNCRKEDNLAPGFDMVYQREFVIPAGIGSLDVHHFQLINIPSDWDRYLTQHGKTAEEIAGVITSSATIGGIYGDADLSSILRISLRIYDTSNPNDFVELAYRDPAPLDPGNLLPLIPSLADSKRFFTAARIAFDVRIELRNTTQIENEVRLDLTMRATF
ncbi:MAG: hypothetical protein SFV22_17655 [Saprospiraceae bacterium]|nr:hypothetical protein [Saprospiraceae bacterium]